jgi:EmrB/QacA subfamily drug resistance transporter
MTATGAGHPRRWAILVVLVVSLFVVMLDNTILNVALPTIQAELAASPSRQQWIVDAYILVFASLLFTMGVLGDRFGRRRLLLFGLISFGLASLLAAMSQTSGQLVASRALMGIGAAAIMPSTLSIITNVFPPAERGRAIGVWAGISGIGIAAGPIVGGALLEHFWWGSVFLVNVPVVIIGTIAVIAVVPESKDPRPGRPDPLGVLLSIVGLTALVYGIIEGPVHGWTDPVVLASIVGGIALLAVFVVEQYRSTHPSFDVRLFANRAFSASAGAVALVFFALMGVTFVLTFYLQLLKGYSPLQAGIWLVPIAIAMAFSAPTSAKWVDAFGVRAVAAAGLSLVALGMLGFQLVTATTTTWLVALLMVLIGAGMGNAMAPSTNAIMSVVPPEKAGAGSAVNNTTRQVGGALGIAVLGSVLSGTYSRHIEPALDQIPADVTASQPDVVAVAQDSLFGTQQVAEQLGLPGLTEAGNQAFVTAMHVTSLVAAGVAAAGVLVVLIWMPRRVDAAEAFRATPRPPEGAERETAPQEGSVNRSAPASDS